MDDPIAPDFVREFQESTVARPMARAFLDTIVAESLKVPARVWREAFLEAILEPDFSGELGKISATTLIIRGDQDVFVPRGDQETLAAAIAGSRLVVFPGAGHAFHWEEPESVADDLATFAEKAAG